MQLIDLQGGVAEERELALKNILALYRASLLKTQF